MYNLIRFYAMKTNNSKTKAASTAAKTTAKGAATAASKGTTTTASATKTPRGNNPTGINQYTKKK